jgi:MoaA/NifB/PqqE/SkfB family radical SAM enzyme
MDGKDMYPSMFKKKRIDDWIKVFRSFKRDIVVMIGGLGEPCIDKKMIPFVKRLDNLTNCIGIVVWTNASRPDLLQEYVSCQKVVFHASYHKDHFEIDAFLDNLNELLRYGKVAKVSYVVTKKTTKEEVLGIADKVAKQGVQWFHVIADRHDWLTNQKHHLEILSLFHGNVSLDYNLALRKTRGVPCMVGKDYIYIESSGDVWPCQSYRQMGYYFLGNVFNGYKTRKLPLLCMFRMCNGCVQEYTQVIGSGLSSNIWGITEYRPIIPDGFLRYMTFPLLFAKPHLLFRHLKRKLINNRKN